MRRSAGIALVPPSRPQRPSGPARHGDHRIAGVLLLWVLSLALMRPAPGTAIANTNPPAGERAIGARPLAVG